MLYITIDSIFGALKTAYHHHEIRRNHNMHKKVPLFEYETFAIRKPKSVEYPDSHKEALTAESELHQFRRISFIQIP